MFRVPYGDSRQAFRIRANAPEWIWKEHFTIGKTFMIKSQRKSRRRYQRLSQKSSDRENLLIEVAQRYCDRRQSMAVIGKELGIKRQTVVRLIKQAREREYIRDLRPLFSPPREHTLANDLRHLYDIRDAVVVKAFDNFVLTRAAVASAAAEYLKNFVFPAFKSRKLRIGIAGGETMSQVVEKMPPLRAELKDRDIEVLPLNLLDRTSREQSASRLAFKLQSKLSDNPVGIRLFMRPAAPFESLEEWRCEATAVKGLKTFRSCVSDWEEMDVALMGVTLAEEQSEIGNELAKVGWIESRESGVPIILNTLLLNRAFEVVEDLFLGCHPSVLKHVAEDAKNRFSILVAGGRTRHSNQSKAECIDLALTHKIATVLITDELTAHEMRDCKRRSSKE